MGVGRSPTEKLMPDNTDDSDEFDDDLEDDENAAQPLPDLASLFGGGGANPLGGLLEQAQRMAEAQSAAADEIVVGVAGGGAVRIEATGQGEFRSVTIDPSAVDPEDVEMLQDLVLAALHDCTTRIVALQQQALGGFSLDAVAGLLGGEPEPPA
jgi:DNA-binding YbaB/EbfC family protein